MAMTCRSESKNIRKVFSAGNQEVLSCSATYGGRSVNLMVEMLNKDYCTANPAEVQEAISGFIASVNGFLDEAGLPMLKAE